MIELEQLKQLIAFTTYGTLSKAAEELYISQPALSRSIQKLEKTLGVELFDRKKNKMELNENGKTIIQYAEKILNLVDEMEEKVNKNNQIQNNFSIPIIDKEAKMTFYCVCKKNIKNEIEKLFDSFSKDS